MFRFASFCFGERSPLWQRLFLMSMMDCAAAAAVLLPLRISVSDSGSGGWRRVKVTVIVQRKVESKCVRRSGGRSGKVEKENQNKILRVASQRLINSRKLRCLQIRRRYSIRVNGIFFPPLSALYVFCSRRGPRTAAACE